MTCSISWCCACPVPCVTASLILPARVIASSISCSSTSSFAGFPAFLRPKACLEARLCFALPAAGPIASPIASSIACSFILLRTATFAGTSGLPRALTGDVLAALTSDSGCRNCRSFRLSCSISSRLAVLRVFDLDGDLFAFISLTSHVPFLYAKDPFIHLQTWQFFAHSLAL